MAVDYSPRKSAKLGSVSVGKKICVECCFAFHSLHTCTQPLLSSLFSSPLLLSSLFSPLDLAHVKCPLSFVFKTGRARSVSFSHILVSFVSIFFVSDYFNMVWIVSLPELLVINANAQGIFETSIRIGAVAPGRNGDCQRASCP